MSLSEGERVRYARQLLLPELAGPAHERVLAAHGAFVAEPAAAARDAFELYAARAGLGARPANSSVLPIVLPSARALTLLAGDDEREPAIALLAGALAATEAVLGAAGVVVPSTFDKLVSVSEEV